MTIEELYKILLTDKPSDIFKNKEKELFSLIPEFKICKGFEQNNEWHIYDVYEHIMHVVDNVSANIILRLSALFHDLGKPSSYKEDENGIGHFRGHWEISQKLFDKFADEHNIDDIIRDRVSNLIYYHDVNLSKLSDDELKSIKDIFGKDGIKQLFELKRADLLAQNKKYYYILDEYKNLEKRLLS